MALLVICRLGNGVRQVTLARWIGVDDSSIVRLLDQLCAAGLVYREDDPSDRRARALSLTKLGENVAQAVEGSLVELHADLLKNFSESDLQTTLSVMKAFAKAGEGAS